MKGDKGIRGTLESLIYSNNEIPFAFRLPKDKETFKYRKLPGNYKDLSETYGPEGIVLELKSYKAKKVCILKGIDKNSKCYLIPVEKADDINFECITVTLTLTFP